jgi:heme/copper-type cytochrome/quinol oxidase subunit 4
MRKEIFIGFLVGIMATVFGFYLYVEFALTGTFEEALTIIGEKSLYGKVLGLAAIPNLLVFFLFIKKRKDYRARGVLIATFLVAFLILIAQFF